MKSSKTSKLAGWAGRVVKLGAQLALVFSAVTAFTPSQAAAETRTLKLYYVHTGERAEITFKKNGRYLPEGLKKLNVFLRDWRRNEPTKMDPRLFDLVWQVYKTAGGRNYITVVSAYRSPATNSMLRSRTRGVAKNSQHTLGKAMDFYIPGVPLKKLRDTALRYQIGGVGYYPKSGSPFVHLDVGSVRHWPRMSRRELLAVFPNGKTLHVPTDGKPLPGYEQALAAYEARKAKGGAVMMASAKPKSKSLFGMLFGGGADEDEDNGESAGRAVASAQRPARAAPAAVPARQAPIPVTPNRAVPAEQGTLVAALPAGDAPLPLNAPRPNAPVDPDAPVEMTADAATAMAFAVPLPGQRPQAADEVMMAMAAPAPNTLEAQVYAGATGAPSAPVRDEIAQLVDADNTPAATAMLSGFVPVPSDRPQKAAQMTEAVLASANVPAAGSAPARDQGNDAIAQLLSNDDHTASIAAPAPNARPEPQEQQLAMVVPQERQQSNAAVAVNNKPQPAKIAVATTGNVRTTAKSGRSAPENAKNNPGAIVQPADAASDTAISTEPVAQQVAASNPVLRNDAMRQAPTVVYTAGFQKDMPTADANRFTGKAVTFMSIAKFSKIN